MNSNTIKIVCILMKNNVVNLQDNSKDQISIDRSNNSPSQEKKKNKIKSNTWQNTRKTLVVPELHTGIS